MSTHTDCNIVFVNHI